MAQSAMGRLIRWPSTRRSVIAFSQVRNYASKQAIPTFSGTPSPELDQALDRFRQELFIPWGLPQRQRSTMFQTKHHHRLEEEPITVNLGANEQYTLRPMTLSSLPTRSDVAHVFQLMQTTNNYTNLVPFVSGLWNSERHLSVDRWLQLVRHTAKVGKLSLIVECANRRNQTGLSLMNLEISRSIFFELHRMALNSNNRGTNVTRAFKMAKQAVDIMDGDRPRPQIPGESVNPKFQPFVIGTLLELSAARALGESAGKDEADEALNYAHKLVAAFPRREIKALPKQTNEAKVIIQWFQEMLPIQNGLRLALKVESITQDKSLRTALGSAESQVKTAIQGQLKRAEGVQGLNVAADIIEMATKI
ncbi:uncharacterized protein N7459_007896 [Penicillium hispanicum]|uniref:uncharacterized protein n=1 Tax=Penicillium hispanicum TaxID=1080232 RepID=UPI00253FC168|nr:uncharacterized protein N7459_007896 [Penicillium hispanicum]KAJ5573469.1 hypothetical protein N7459_007896 [Penicillium hispanicum]